MSFSGEKQKLTALSSMDMDNMRHQQFRNRVCSVERTSYSTRGQHALHRHTHGNDTKHRRPFVAEDRRAYLPKYAKAS